MPLPPPSPSKKFENTKCGWNENSSDDDQFCPRIVKIGAILGYFWPFRRLFWRLLRNVRKHGCQVLIGPEVWLLRTKWSRSMVANYEQFQNGRNLNRGCRRHLPPLMDNPPRVRDSRWIRWTLKEKRSKTSKREATSSKPVKRLLMKPTIQSNTSKRMGN